MTRSDRFLQRNRKVAQARRGANDTVGNQNFNAYRKDAGWKMSDDQYADYKKSESEFNTALSGGYSSIESSRSANASNAAKVDKQEKELSKLKGTSLAAEYSTYSKSFIPVRITNGNKVEATYMLPKSSARTLDSKLSKDFYTGWFNGGKTLNVDVTSRSGKVQGGELHRAFSNGVQSVKSSFYKANSSAVKKANQKVADAKATGKAQIATSRTNLDNSEKVLAGEFSTLKASEKTRKDNIQAFSSDYSTALEGRRNLMKRG